MKKITFSIICFFIFSMQFSYAQNHTEPLPTAPADDKIKENLKEKINDLKERLATRVAEIRSQNKRAFYGEIMEKDDSTFLLEKNGLKTTVVYDEETSIFLIENKVKTPIEASTLTIGEKVSAFGILDLDQKTLLAKRIIIQKTLAGRIGRVSEVDVNQGTVALKEEKENLVYDYEIRTKCLAWKSESGKFVSCGLSKIKAGDFVVIRGEEKENQRFTILRILVLPSPTS